MTSLVLICRFTAEQQAQAQDALSEFPAPKKPEELDEAEGGETA